MLTVDKLNAGYGKLQVLHDLSLTIEDEHFTAILGPNGSGKSTLLKSVFGLTTITGGSIRLGDVELTRLPTERIGREGLAYVPQKRNVFASLSVQDNLRLALRHMTAKQAAQALAEVYELFSLLDERRRQRAGLLSGGQRQMLAIALGWLAYPKMMLLDEPSAGLAPIVSQAVFESLDKLRERGVSMVVVEQNSRTALQWCTDVIILREGEVAFRGTREECLANEDVVAAYLGIGARALGGPRPTSD